MLSVQIPGGIESGMRLRLANEGEHGVQGGPQGDLYVAVTVKPHPPLSPGRPGHRLRLCRNLVTAILGGRVEVPTLKGTPS